MAADKENFLSRWSRTKTEQRQSAEKEKSVPQKAGSSERAPELPPVEGLTADSEFSSFMHPKVSDALRRAALKKLFADPHFNMPDPFEPFSGDWTVGEPIPEAMLATLNQARTLLFQDKEKQTEEEQKQDAGEPPENSAKKDDEPGRQDA